MRSPSRRRSGVELLQRKSCQSRHCTDCFPQVEKRLKLNTPNCFLQVRKTEAKYTELLYTGKTEAKYTTLLSAGLPFQKGEPQAQGLNSTAARGCVSSYSTGMEFQRRVPVTMQQQHSRVNDNNNKQGTTNQQKHKRTMIVVMLLLRAKTTTRVNTSVVVVLSLLLIGLFQRFVVRGRFSWSLAKQASSATKVNKIMTVKLTTQHY